MADFRKTAFALAMILVLVSTGIATASTTGLANPNPTGKANILNTQPTNITPAVFMTVTINSTSIAPFLVNTGGFDSIITTSTFTVVAWRSDIAPNSDTMNVAINTYTGTAEVHNANIAANWRKTTGANMWKTTTNLGANAAANIAIANRRTIAEYMANNHRNNAPMTIT